MSKMRWSHKSAVAFVLTVLLLFSFTAFADEAETEPEVIQTEMQAEAKFEDELNTETLPEDEATKTVPTSSAEEKSELEAIPATSETEEAELEAVQSSEAAAEEEKEEEEEKKEAVRLEGNAKAADDSSEEDVPTPGTIEPETTEPETEEPEVKNGWDENHEYYYVEDQPVTGLYTINEEVYGFDGNGKLVKNSWLTVEGVTYGLDEEGKLYTESTLKEYKNAKGASYYRGYYESGKMVKNSWLTIGGDTYGFDENGSLIRNKVAEYTNSQGGKYYRGYDKDGKMVKDSWLTVGKDKYYFNADGSSIRNKNNIMIGNAYYCFGADGKLQTNTVKKIGSYYYGFGSAGKRVTGPQKIGNSLYYFNTSNGHAYVNGMKTINGATYFFAADGKMLTGWQTVGGKTRYFLPDTGKLASGLVKVGSKIYWLNSNGVKVTSSGSLNGKYIIVKSSGEVLTGKGWTMYNGYKYYIENDGHSVRTDTSSLVKGSSLILKMNKQKCVVTVYAYDSATKKYDIPVKSFVCSPGKRTPLGRHYLKSKNRWVRLVGATEDTNTWGQWGMFYNKEKNSDGTWSKRFFHSVYYDEERNPNSLNVRAWNMLGKICSHGCIRLESVNVKWIYDNKSRVKYVQIYESSNPGPFGLKRAVKLPSWHTWDPTDPTMHYKCKQRGCH